jgi:hypothetical protein
MVADPHIRLPTASRDAIDLDGALQTTPHM